MAVCCWFSCCRRSLPRSRSSPAACGGARTMVWTSCWSPVFFRSSASETGWCLTTPEPTVSERWENSRRPYTTSSLRRTGNGFGFSVLYQCCPFPLDIYRSNFYSPYQYVVRTSPLCHPLFTQVRDSELRRHAGHCPEELLSGPVFSEARSERERHLHSSLAKRICPGATAAALANFN